MYTHTLTYMHTYMYVYIHTYIHTYITGVARCLTTPLPHRLSTSPDVVYTRLGQRASGFRDPCITYVHVYIHYIHTHTYIVVQTYTHLYMIHTYIYIHKCNKFIGPAFIGPDLPFDRYFVNSLLVVLQPKYFGSTHCHILIRMIIKQFMMN